MGSFGLSYGQGLMINVCYHLFLAKHGARNMIKISLLFLSISLTTLSVWSAVLQVKENGKLIKDLILSTKTNLPYCQMNDEVIEECYFNLNIYSCRDELKIYSVDVLYQKDAKKKNFMTNIVLYPPQNSTKPLRLIKTFEIERIAFIDFNRHFPFEQINLSQFQCALNGDLKSLPLKTHIECKTTGALKLQFEETSNEIDVFKWCGKPHIIR